MGAAVLGLLSSSCGFLDAVCALPGPLRDPAGGLPGPDHLLQSAVLCLGLLEASLS